MIILRAFLIVSLVIIAFGAQANTDEFSYIKSEDLYRDADVYNVQLAPDGKHVSYAVRKGTSVFIEFFEISTGKRKEVVSFTRENKLLNYVWVNESHLYVTLSARGQRRGLVLRFYPSRENRIGTEWSIVDQGYLVSTLPDDRFHLIYSKTNQESQKQRLYKIHINDLKKRVFRDEDIIDESPKTLVRYIFDSSSDKLIGIFVEESEVEDERPKISMKYKPDNDANWQELLSINDNEYSFLPVGFISDNELAVLTNKKTDKVVLQVFNIDSQTLGEVLYAHKNYDITDATISNTGDVVSVEFYSAGLPVVDYLRTADSNLQNRFAATFDNGSPYIIDRNEDSNLMLVVVLGSVNPGQVFAYNGEKDEFYEIASSNRKLVDYAFAPTTSFKIKNQNDDFIEAYITKPINGGVDHNTLIVNPHGGPVGVRDNARFNKDTQFLVNRGFTVLTVNFRGSAGYGKDFLDSGKAQFGQAIEQDISAVVDHILGQQSFNHVCAMGSSYGAFSSVMLAMQHPDIYECVIAGFGIYDIPLLFNSDNFSSIDSVKEKIVKVVGENTPEKRDISPLYRVAELQAPILLIAGKKDYVASFEHSVRMQYMLEKHEKDHEFIAYNLAEHGHDDWGGDRHEMATTVNFLMETLELNAPSFDNVNEDDTNKLAWMKDYEILADYASRNRYIEKDMEQAYTFNKKAAELGSLDRQYALAKQYIYGDGTEQNIQKGIALLGESAEKDHFNSIDLLASIYLEGTYVSPDSTKAKALFDKALEMEPGLDTTLNMAEYFCLADKNNQDVKRCTDEYWSAHKLKNTNKEIYAFDQSLSKALVKGRYNANDRLLINELITKVYEVTDFDIEVSVDSFGLYRYQMNKRFGRLGEYLLTDSQALSSHLIGLSNGSILIGTKYDVDNSGSFNASELGMAIVVLDTFNEQNVIVDTAYFPRVRQLRDYWQAFGYLYEHREGDTYKLSIYGPQGDLQHEHFVR
jgi:dipeptidyl aminopeptidase/acylaminoacyl peptidase